MGTQQSKYRFLMINQTILLIQHCGWGHVVQEAVIVHEEYMTSFMGVKLSD